MPHCSLRQPWQKSVHELCLLLWFIVISRQALKGELDRFKIGTIVVQSYRNSMYEIPFPYTASCYSISHSTTFRWNLATSSQLKTKLWWAHISSSIISTSTFNIVLYAESRGAVTKFINSTGYFVKSTSSTTLLTEVYTMSGPLIRNEIYFPVILSSCRLFVGGKYQGL